MTPSGAAADLLAHGGGAPEALAIGLPVLVLVLFAVLERRARRRAGRREGPEPVDERGTGDA